MILREWIAHEMSQRQGKVKIKEVDFMRVCESIGRVSFSQSVNESCIASKTSYLFRHFSARYFENYAWARKTTRFQVPEVIEPRGITRKRRAFRSESLREKMTGQLDALCRCASFDYFLLLSVSVDE